MPAESPIDLSKTGPNARYQQWLFDNAARLRADDTPPGSPTAVMHRATRIRRLIREAEGAALVPEREQAPLDARVLGVLRRDGYRIERLTFQTRPGCYATANVYVPAGSGKRHPAVLCVHGHWRGARRDPVVQSRCIGLAKLGFLALALDAWGAGERGTVPGENEYHGGLLGASLWPVDMPLHGLQLNDNVRALNYLQSRPDVDPERLGCTGASGGGNQTTYLSAFDDRIGCAVPVCSVGTFASYFTTASCVDEVLLGGLAIAEQGDLLGLVAPNALMVITASRDAPHFGPKVASEALARALPYFKACRREARLKHVVFDSGHDYSQPMREAMYGWMRRWLQNEGDGSPVPEPSLKLEDPADLACFEPSARPARVKTTVALVHERARRAADAMTVPTDTSTWERMRRESRERARDVLGLPRGRTPKLVDRAGQSDEQLLHPESGVEIPVSQAGRGRKRTVVLLHPDGRQAALRTGVADRLAREGFLLRALELRGSGELMLEKQGLGDSIPDHNLVEWSLWLNRPLLGQWVFDLRQLLRLLPEPAVVLVGWREAGLAALLTAALDERAAAVAAVEAPASLVTDRPPHHLRMAALNPGLLRVGDVPQLAALAAPRGVVLANPVQLDGSALTAEAAAQLYSWPRQVYGLLGAPERWVARTGMLDDEIALKLRGALD